MAVTAVRARSPQQAEILALAARIQGCRHCALDWFRNDAVAEFGGLTAQQMLRHGRGEAVLGFLRSIACGRRG